MKAALYKSLALHAVVFLLFMVDLPLFWREDMVVSQPPIIVDLEQVKISEITNLPAKAKIAEETKTPARAKKMPPKPEPKPRSKPTPQPQKVEQPSVIESQPEPVPEEAPLPPKQDFVVPPQPSKPKLPDKSRNRNGRRRQNRLPNRRAKNGAEESRKEKNAAGQRFEKPYGFRQCVGKSLSAADSEATIQKERKPPIRESKAAAAVLISASCRFQKPMPSPPVCVSAGTLTPAPWELRT